MEGTMESTTGISTPPEEVDNLIQVKRRVVTLDVVDVWMRCG